MSAEIDVYRERLWPSRAVLLFGKLLTQCSIPTLIPGQQITREQVRLGQPCWSTTDLIQIGTSFENVSAHTTAFQLTLMEEARESILEGGWNAEDEVVRIEIGKKANASNARSEGDRKPKKLWFEGEVVSINTKFGEQTSFARSVGVAMVKFSVAIDSEFTYASGDLLYIVTPDNRALLGIIQGWDPDYSGIQTSSINSLSACATADDCITVLVYFGYERSISIDLTSQVDQDSEKKGSSAVHRSRSNTIDSTTSSSSRTLVMPLSCGMISQFVCLSNAMTFIREFQALMSVRYLNKGLQQVIMSKRDAVNAGEYSSQTGALNSGSAAGTRTHGSVGVVGKGNSGPAKSSGPQLSCPPSVPRPLWNTLLSEYNDTQLRAIESICRPGSSGQNSTFTLLQGPPGTGKTRTILAMISVFLAGAGLVSTSTRTGTKIVPGASLRHVQSTATPSTSTAPSKKIRVLLCAPSNTAVDELVYRLYVQGVKGSDGTRKRDLRIVRIGQPGGTNSTHVSTTSWRRNAISASSSRLASTINTASPYREKTGDVPTSGDILAVAEKFCLDYLVEEKRKMILMSEKKNLSGGSSGANVVELRKQILESADIICATLSGSGSQPILEIAMRIPDFSFDVLIIDEAAQAVEPSTLIPMKYNPKSVVMVGDPCQLPATVFSRVAKEHKYDQSLFQRLRHNGHPVIMLDLQYRMHRLIAEYPSLRFYENRLESFKNKGVSIDLLMDKRPEYNKAYHQDQSGLFRPVVIHNVNHGREYRDGVSVANYEEAVYIANLYGRLRQDYPSQLNTGSVGIIVFYKAQRRLLVRIFRERFGVNNGVEISTVDGFQGREKDIIILSCVRAPQGVSSASSDGSSPIDDDSSVNGGALVGDTESCISKETTESSRVGTNIGFLRDWQRLNVAITRSKYALWIVGHVSTLKRDKEWAQLIEFANRKKYVANRDNPQVTSSYAGSIVAIAPIAEDCAGIASRAKPERLPPVANFPLRKLISGFANEQTIAEIPVAPTLTLPMLIAPTLPSLAMAAVPASTTVGHGGPSVWDSEIHETVRSRPSANSISLPDRSANFGPAPWIGDSGRVESIWVDPDDRLDKEIAAINDSDVEDSYLDFDGDDELAEETEVNPTSDTRASFALSQVGAIPVSVGFVQDTENSSDEDSSEMESIVESDNGTSEDIDNSREIDSAGQNEEDGTEEHDSATDEDVTINSSVYQSFPFSLSVDTCQSLSSFPNETNIDAEVSKLESRPVNDHCSDAIIQKRKPSWNEEAIEPKRLKSAGLGNVGIIDLTDD